MSNIPVLLLRLEGPLQSWGVRSRWDVRDTGYEPTKSGIVGLIGCAIGLGRADPELEILDQSLDFGVRLDCPGIVATDFQTVTGFHRTAEGGFKHKGGTAKNLSSARTHGESTIVSPRDYLHDASFLVGISLKKSSADNKILLQTLAHHLKNPKWPLYLGRKSCVPSRPILERLTEEYPSIEAAFRSEFWGLPRGSEVIGGLQKEIKDLPELIEAWIESTDGSFERQDAMRLNQLRFYDFRRCRRIEIETASLPRRKGQ